MLSVESLMMTHYTVCGIATPENASVLNDFINLYEVSSSTVCVIVQPLNSKVIQAAVHWSLQG